MNTTDTHSLPTLPQLAKATAVAVAAAAMLLMVVILPAEYGIDPTGAGKALGLMALSAGGAAAESVTPVPAATAAVPAPLAPVLPESGSTAVARSQTPMRSDTMSLTLQPNEGAEIKASMRQGQQFVFQWATNGEKVDFDMHGEPPNAGDKFTSYWKAKQQAGAQGTFVAPFDGSHGWYWRNRSDKPVTINVNVTGFHEKLYRPA